MICFFKKKFKNAIVTVGQIKSAEICLQLFNILEKLEYNLPIIFSLDHIYQNIARLEMEQSLCTMC